ncbi:MAG: translation initiation factor IF-3 [Planctomycetes bacterium]|nr:translation initiation factor IF-3 [Planctomycetota bacterium]
MIRIRQVRLIDDTGAMVGVVDTEMARQMAYDKGLDLVEVSPEARPPVCKVMDYGKFLYTLKKKEHDSKRKQRKVETKEIRLRPKIADHDVGYKAKQARDFLADGDKVQVTMLFRGREMSHMDVARTVMDSFITQLADISKVERAGRLEGRRLSILLLSTAPPKPHDAGRNADKHPGSAKHDGTASKDGDHDDRHESQTKHDDQTKDNAHPPEGPQTPPQTDAATQSVDATIARTPPVEPSLPSEPPAAN